MSERVLLVGGAGYVGCVLAERLLDEGYSVRVLDNLMYGQTGLLGLCARDGFEFVRGDCRDPRAMKGAIEGCDAVVHLAAIVGAPACDRQPRLAKEVNLAAAELLATSNAGHRRVVFPCTNSGYGTTSGTVHCTEDSPLEPVSLYGRTKVEAERVMLGEGAVSLRLATAFGPSPRMRFDLLVNDFTRRAWADRYLVLYEAHFRRNYVHVGDAADAFVFALRNHAAMAGRAFNVGLRGADLSKAELAAAIGNRVRGLVVHEAEVGRDPDRRNYVVSTDRIAALGFEARRTLDEGIRQVISVCAMLPPGAFLNV